MARVTWEVVDGYLGKSRPQFVEVPDEDLDECEDDDERNDLIESYVQADFDQKIYHNIIKVEK